MNILGLIGPPGSGKSTLVRLALGRLKSEARPVGHGLFRAVAYGPAAAPLVVPGRYDPASWPFAGTDRLSMAVGPDARAFVAHLAQAAPAGRLLWEGDRLATAPFMEACAQQAGSSNVQWWVLDVDPAEQRRRLAERHWTPNDTWLKGRHTKVNNLAERFCGAVRRFRSDTAADRQRLLRALLEWIDGGTP